MITTIRPKDHKEWLQTRTQGIGSSEIASICGVSKYESRRQYWQRKMLERSGEASEFSNKATEFGHLTEEAVAQGFAKYSGHKIITTSNAEFLVRNDIRPYLQASPDRMYWIDEDGKRNDDNKTILECKTTNLDLSEETEDLMQVEGYTLEEGVENGVKNVALVQRTLNIPISWYMQVQYQMLAMEKQNCALAYMRLMSRDFGYCFIDRNQDICDSILKECDEMWNHLEDNTEPPVTTVDDAKEAYPNHIDGKTKEADDLVMSAYNRIKEIETAMKPLDKEKKELQETIKVFFEDNESITHDRKVIATFKSGKPKMTFNTDRFAIDHSDLYEQYLEEKQAPRTLRTK